MVDACYVCGRTQADLDRMNEEVRARVYLSYFSNARGLIDEQHRRITFLQRLKDEESGDAHFRISAAQVFADPAAYKKLMPWIDALMEIERGSLPRAEPNGTIGDLLERLLSRERARTAELEAGLERIRAAFGAGTRSPFALEPWRRAFPVDWAVHDIALPWHASEPGEREPLAPAIGSTKPTVEIQLHLCTACRQLVAAK